MPLTPSARKYSSLSTHVFKVTFSQVSRLTGKKITEFLGGDEERYCFFLSLLERCQNKRILEKENVSGSSPRLRSQARKQSGMEKRRQPL